MARNSKKKELPSQAPSDIENADMPVVDPMTETMSELGFPDETADSSLSASETSSEIMIAAVAESHEAQDDGESVEPLINLDANLSIQNAVKLYDRLKKAYAKYDALEIDASHVNSVDTASLQLFVALKKDAMKNNKQVDFFQPSARFVESARLLDLLDVLEIIDV